MDSATNAALSAEATELLEALPVAAVVVTTERQLLAGNRALSELFGDPSAIADSGGAIGDLARCVNAVKNAEGCGHAPECAQCTLKAVADQAISGDRVAPREISLRREDRGRVAEQVFLISAAPYRPSNGSVGAVLLIQEVTELHRLRGLIPICASCKKIRGADQDWQRLERFIEEHSYACFTHSVCPDCAKRLYPEHAAAG